MRHQVLLSVFILFLLVSLVASQDGERRGRRRGGKGRGRGRDRGQGQGAGQGGRHQGHGAHRARGRHAEMRQFIQMLRGRYSSTNEAPRQMTVSFMPVKIIGLQPPTQAVFFHAHVGDNDIRALHTYEPMGQGSEAHIHMRAWVFKRPEDYVDAWQDPWKFLALQPSQEENEDLTPRSGCDIRYRHQEDGNWVTEGTSEACRIPLTDGSGMYRHIGAATLAPNSYSYILMVHQADGTMVRQVNIRMQKTAQIPGTPIGDFNSIKGALVGGASASFKLDLRRCASDVENFTPHIIGGPIDEFQYVPAGAFGPQGYLRAADHSLIVTSDYRGMRLVTLHIYEDGAVQFMLDQRELGQSGPRVPRVFNCTLNDGPMGQSILVLRRPAHFRHLTSIIDIGMALLSGHKVRMTVDLSLCQRADNGTDIITQGGTMINDHDMSQAADGQRVLTFNTAAIGQALPGCTPGNMISGASAILREEGNTVTLHQWGISYADFSTCFQTVYECTLSSGTTFFMV